MCELCGCPSQTHGEIIEYPPRRVASPVQTFELSKPKPAESLDEQLSADNQPNAKNNFLKSTSQVSLKSDDDFSDDDKYFMNIALDLARQGAMLGEVPVGAVIVFDHQIIAQGFNCPISQKNATAHAEMLVIEKACEYLDNYRLPKGCTLYVTLEPCTMCLGAVIHSRIERVVFATTEPKSGVIVSQENFANKSYFNHYLTIEGGLFAKQSKAILQEFFNYRREVKKKQSL